MDKFLGVPTELTQQVEFKHAVPPTEIYLITLNLFSNVSDLL